MDEHHGFDLARPRRDGADGDPGRGAGRARRRPGEGLDQRAGEREPLAAAARTRHAAACPARAVKLRSYKFLILPVVQQLDDDGTVMGEGQTEQPDVAFGVRGLKEYAESFEMILAQREAEMNGGSNGQGEERDGLQGGS